jgi:hypothetical protein
MKKIFLPILFFAFFNTYLCAQMSGIYTVCSDLTCDFPSISEAVDSLVSQTMNGPVTLLLSDTIITEQVTIPYIEGSGSTNTLTLRPADALPGEQPVHIVYTSTAADTNFVIAFDSAQHVIIQNIDIQAQGPDFSTCLSYLNGSRSVSINACNLISQETSTSSVIKVVDLSSDSLSISNSRILNGGSGISLFGGVGNNIKNMQITDNEFINNSLNGIEVSKGENLSIMHNYFETDNFYTDYKGIYFNNVYGYSIDRNYLYLKNGMGMDLTYSGVTDTSWISNNIIYISGFSESDDIGLGISNGNYQVACYNTVVIDSISSETSSAFSFPSATGTGSSNVVLNNNLANFAGGYAISVPDTDPLLIAGCDYNNLYGDQTSLTNYHGTDYDSLANWQLATSFDSNSVSVDPLFVDTTFIMYCAPELENAGIPVSVDHDFGNYTRDMLTPDIGAIEKNIAGWHLTAHSAEICDGESYTIDAGPVNYASYSWSNGSSEQSVELTEGGWYYLIVTDGCTEAFDSLFLDVQNCNPGQINNTDDISGITVMPNPAADRLTIQFENPAEANIEVITLGGNVVLKSKVASQQVIHLDLSSLKNGIYILKIDSEKYDYQTKIIKME